MIKNLIEFSKENTLSFQEADSHLQPCIGFAYGFAKCQKLFPFFEYVLLSIEKGHGYYTQLIKDAKKASNELIKKWQKDKNYYHQIENQWLKAQEKQNIIIKEIENTNLAALNDQELKKLYRKLQNTSIAVWAYFGLPEVIGIYEETIFPEKVMGKYKISQMDFDKIAINLSQSRHESFINFYEKRIRKLKNKRDQNQNIDSEIEKLIKDYYWIRTGYYGASRLTKEEIEKDINLSKKTSKQKNDRNEIIKKYKLSDKLVDIFDLIAKMAYWRDERKKFSLPVMYWTYKICDEIAKRKNIDKELIYNLTDIELEQVLSGKKMPSELSKNGNITLVINKGKVYFYRGKKHQLIFKNFFKFSGSAEQLNGIVVYKKDAKIIGRVKIVHNPSGIDLKKNEILVTNMTRPEFIPLMRQAQAVITDQGGLTCHAAIVSREMGIPCIIGTKIATKILQDGDYVEVNANTGVITKLKDAKREIIKKL